MMVVRLLHLRGICGIFIPPYLIHYVDFEIYQQGPAGAGGFQPMHTKPIISQRGYTPTTGSSHSSRSRSESSMTYSKNDHHMGTNDRTRLPVNL